MGKKKDLQLMPTRVFIVTGSSRGIGLATTLALLEAADTVVVGVSRGAAAAAVASHGRYEHVTGSVTDEATQRAAVAAAAAREGTAGRIGGVVFNAGVVQPIARLDGVDVGRLRALLDVNVVSAVGLAQKAAAHAGATARFVFVSSGAAVAPYRGWGAYCASKAALNMVVRVLALELPHVVSVAVRPGVVDTDMQAALRLAENRDAMGQDNLDYFTALHADAKLLSPDLPAKAIARLVLNAPKELSGEFINWNDPRLESL
ncbi:hypothetical protein HK100_010025 [Physocladia obscura]|uniref:Ketoreductase domain-containing protein n=1 Tax=Physocladia obscura TaxID=109957 RepID=A0AAD5T3D8_9FUNG|nr:hypothetical protein HK100_010025 [Physocladia obscura]